MDNTFLLNVTACDRVFFEGRCRQVVIPLEDGEKEIQAHHENMVFAVEVGELRIQTEDGEWIVGVVGTGFAQVINNRVSILVAREAKERAREQLRQKQSIQEYYMSKASLARAMSRLRYSSKDDMRV